MSDLPLQIDHVVIGVKDQLDDASARYRNLGFSLLARGHHTLGSSNHLAVFGDDYIELLGYEAAQAAAQVDQPIWRYPVGLIGLVFKPGNVRDVARQVKARGVAVDEPLSFSRPVTLPDGRVSDARFQVLHLPAGTSAAGVVFFCQHDTPENVWQDAWRTHPNGTTGIQAFVIAAADPAASVRPFVQALGDQALSPVEGGLRLATGRSDVLFLTPQQIDVHLHGQAARDLGPGDRYAGLTLRTRDLAAARAALARGGIEGVIELPHRLIVPAHQAFGLAIVFTDQD